METETLSNYKHVQDEHLLSGTVDENSSGNAEDIELVQSKKTPEKSEDLVIERSPCEENNVEDKKDSEKDNDCNEVETRNKQSLSDESDNDVDEEEEHIPLNINQTNSDSEKSDDDLDESEQGEDLLENEKIDVDNDPLDTEKSPLDIEKSPLEVQDIENLSEDKCLDKDDTRDDSSDKNDVENGVKSPVDIEESENLSSDKKLDKDGAKNVSDPLDETSQVSIECIDDVQNDDLPVNIDQEEQDPLNVDNQDDDDKVDDHSNKKTEMDVTSIENDVVDSSLKDNTGDQEQISSVESPKVHEDNNDDDIMIIESEDKSELKTKNTDMETKDEPNTETEKTEEVISLDEEEKMEKDNEAVNKDTEAKTEEKSETDNKEEKAEEKLEKDKEAVDTNEKMEEKLDKDKEAVDTNEKVEEKLDKDKEVTDKVEETAEKLEKDNKGKGDEKVEGSNKKDSDEGTEPSLLKETLTQGKNYEGDDDIDMDEDFDPSLLCPDINMEVDEAPVITSSDAPPPSHRDDNKSPLLYEPMFSTYVDEMTGAEIHFDLTPDEEGFRLQTFGEKNPVQFTKIHCTACNVHLGSALDGQGNRFVHPLLKVLICKNCYHFYTSGEFEKDEDGSELYCRWCGQGGQVMCCSSCEMVFCKKCIRINFDRKKLAEIRDSDDWFCFRCNPAQITFQRIHCAEFMEYVRRETQRASTLENPVAYMTVDYTQCCTPQKKKPASEPASSEPKKKKPRKAAITVDPDYDPHRDAASPQPSTSGYKPPQAVSTSASTSSNLVPIAPKPTDPSKNGGIVKINQNSSFKIGSTTVKPKTHTVINRPRVQVVGSASTSTSTPGSSRTPAPSPGYIKILPGGIRVPGDAPRQFTPRQRTQPMRPAVPTPMKHEWFEKTVRAAARVNSNLSYTLTQLNRAQANATSVEALAVVHNKLQEILSTSINSLIQIRKNLRTEFIAGIKNIRFPPKPQTTTPTSAVASSSTSLQDDDVIFVSPTVSPVPPPIPSTPSIPSTSSTPLSGLSLPSSVSLIKKTTPTSSITTSTPTTSQNQNGGLPRSFLRVKSLTALQSVPSECITIPDDPPPPPLAPIRRIMNTTKLDDRDTIEIIDDKEEESPNVIIVNGLDAKNNKEKSSTEDEVRKKDVVTVPEDKSVSNRPEDKPISDNSKVTIFNLKDPLSPDMIKMKNTKVLLKRSSVIDELVRSRFGKVNGDLAV